MNEAKITKYAFEALNLMFSIRGIFKRVKRNKALSKEVKAAFAAAVEDAILNIVDEVEAAVQNLEEKVADEEAAAGK